MKQSVLSLEVWINLEVNSKKEKLKGGMKATFGNGANKSEELDSTLQWL